jgi:putative membrane-bound dehydrogenase-like protein
MQPAMSRAGIEMDYTETLSDLNPAKLAGYDCLAIFANWTVIQPEQEKALLDFVHDGGGFVPLHCASYCFLNSPKYIELVGGQFLRHGTGVVQETIVDPDHPVMKGLSPIESWDETYVHTKLTPDRIVLAERRDKDGKEPYTWVRSYGKGRVFYTAWGHDERTWGNAGFIALVENGIRWSSENSPAGVHAVTGLPPLERMPAPSPLPNYQPGPERNTPISTMQKPLSPAESAKHLATLHGFEATLFASEPDFVKAIWMDWDERGRMWIAETVDYPNNPLPAGEGHDHIKIIEDTDGDGKADKVTIFADKLNMPSSFVFVNGGIIVKHSDCVEFFKDTNGDDVADERKVLFHGWNMGDTHATASNLRYGFDNWIWGVVGYSGFNGEVGGKRLRFGQGIYRFKPDGSALEYIRSSNNNTWGLGLTEDNLILGSTANGNASMYMPIANRYYEAVRGWSAARIESIADNQRFYPLVSPDKVRQVDFHGQYTAGAGSAIYTARSFPEEFWNKVQFVAEPTGHLLGKFHLEGVGADFIAHNGRNFAASDDEWTSPVCAEVGPDGALWVSDWYNYIIQHNPTPRGFDTGPGNAYVSPLRDKTHGRLYRIAYKDGKPSAKPDLVNASPAQLVAVLKNDNLLWRMHAQRKLITRGQKDIVPALIALLKDTSVDATGLNPAALHSLWTLHALGALDGSDSSSVAAATGALKHPSAGVRRGAVMTLPKTETTAKALLDGKLLSDTDAQVRMATLLAMSELPASESTGAAIFAALNEQANTEDRWIPDAAVAAAAQNDAGFLKTVLATFKPAINDKAEEAAPVNLIRNASFEDVSNDRPSGWRSTTHGGRGEFGLASFGRTGGHAVKISSESGGDLSWATQVKVKPRTDYILRGWIKPEGVRKRGNAQGAMFNVHELQDPIRGGTKTVSGDGDWTQVELAFNSGQMTDLTINCLFGGWGQATGTAYFDDVELVPAPGSELGGEVGRVVRLVTGHYAGRAPSDSIVATLAALKGSPIGLASAVLDGLVNGWPEGKGPNLSAADKTLLNGLMTAMPEAVRDRLFSMSRRWGQPDLFQSALPAIVAGLKKQITDGALAEDRRIAAAKRLIALEGNAADVAVVIGQITSLTPPTLASGLVGAITESKDAAAAGAVIGRWNEFTPSVKRSAVFALMRRAEWASSLLGAVEKGTIAKTDLAADQWAQMKQSPNKDIAALAAKVSAVPGAVSADRADIVKKLMPLAAEHGDPTRGKVVFDSNCASCHTINGAGGKIGPELTGVGARARSEILMAIIDPNQSVEANFRLWNVTLKDGDSYSGRLEAETQNSVEILDTAGQKHVVQRKDIETLEGTMQSIMPIGFELLPADDLKGLLEYLGQSTH